MNNRIKNLSWRSVGTVATWRVREAEAGSRALDYLLSRFRPTSFGSVPATMGETIRFGEGSSDLEGRARATLLDLVALVRAHPAMKLVIGGFASQPGSTAYAMRLGLRRVQAIRMFLISQDLDPVRIEIAIRGVGWSLFERTGEAADAGSPRLEYRLQIADPRWVRSSN